MLTVAVRTVAVWTVAVWTRGGADGGGADGGGVDRGDGPGSEGGAEGEGGGGRRVALLFGAEGPGLSPETLAAADVRATIPMRAEVDSLNVGVAAGIAFWELRRRPRGSLGAGGRRSVRR